MKSVEISVIIPCYNHAIFLEEAIQSVLNQDFDSYECIIVDDGSTDHTKEIGKRYENEYENIRYIFQENKGLSAARNMGIKNSVGNFILPLDADDKISINYLKETYKKINSNPNISVVYGDSFTFGKSLRKWNLPNYSFNELLYKNMIHCCGLYRKKCWADVNGYDENLRQGLEDWEFWISILKKNKIAVKLKTCFFYYRQNEESMIRKDVINNHYGYKSRCYIFNKHYKLYVTSNVYDLYYENHNLKKKFAKPHLYFSLRELIKFCFSRVLFLFSTFSNKIVRRILIK